MTIISVSVFATCAHIMHPLFMQSSLTVFPSLAQNQLEVLRTLVQNNPTPTKDMINIWAARTHAELEDVKMWVSYQQAKAMPREPSEHSMSASPTTSHPHLPTPARSLSPRVREMSLPLIATKEEPSPPGTPLLKASTHPAHVSHTNSSHRTTGCADKPDDLHPQSHEGSQLVSITMCRNFRHIR